MTFEELVKELGLEKDKADVLKKEFNSKEKEITDLNKKVEKLEKSGEGDKEKLEKLDIITKAFKIDVDSEDLDKHLDEIKDSFTKEVKGTEDYKDLSRELTKTNRELEKAKKELATANESLATEKAERIKGVKNNEIMKELQAQNVIKAEQWLGKFFNEVTLDEDGNLYMKGEDGKEIGMKDGIAEWAKANPEFVKAQTRGGSGSGSGGSSGNKDELNDFMKSVIEEGNNNSGEQKSLGELFG